MIGSLTRILRSAHRRTVAPPRLGTPAKSKQGTRQRTAAHPDDGLRRELERGIVGGPAQPSLDEGAKVTAELHGGATLRKAHGFIACQRFLDACAVRQAVCQLEGVLSGLEHADPDM